MLVPAILYKDEIIKNLKRQLYEDEMMYYYVSKVLRYNDS